MISRKESSLDRVLGRLDNLDAVNLTNLVQRLARERSLLEAVFNAIREGILIIDDKGVIEYANQAASELVGVRSSDLGRVTLWKLVPDLARTFEGGSKGGFRPAPTFLKELHLNYPESRYVRLYVTSFEEEVPGEGSVNRFEVILTAIAQEKESAEARVESDRISAL